jgi:hypothetical protein
MHGTDATKLLMTAPVILYRTLQQDQLKHPALWTDLTRVDSHQ